MWHGGEGGVECVIGIAQRRGAVDEDGASDLVGDAPHGDAFDVELAVDSRKGLGHGWLPCASSSRSEASS